jgi:hypothetical protein
MNKILTIILSLVCLSLYAQVRPNHNRAASQIIACASSEYGFMIEGKYYKDNQILFFCPDKFPLIITAVSSDSIPITDINALWKPKKCVIDTAYGDHSVIRIEGSGLQNQIAEFEVKFKAGPKNETLNLTIKRITLLEIDNTLSARDKKYSFDDNRIKDYPFYGDGKPYKFIAASQTDSLSFIPDHDNKLKMTKFKPIGKFNYTVPKKRVLHLQHAGALPIDSIYVIACDTIKQVKVDIYPQKTLHVNLYTLAETDDDIANYCIDKDGDGKPYETGDVDGSLLPDCKTPISSSSHECVLPGPDGSLDLFNNITPFWTNKDNDIFKSIDSITIVANQNHLRKIYAGSDKFCNERPLPKDTASYPVLSTAEINKISNNLNLIYNQVGINVIANYKGLKYVNFDSHTDDNIIETSPLRFEHNYVHVQWFGGNLATYVEADTTTVWITNNLDNHTLKGIASGVPVNNPLTKLNSNLGNSVFIDYLKFENRTISHEIGHARFYLFHPDVTTDCGGNGWSNNGLINPVNSDAKNFMNSGCTQFLFTTSINNFIIRKYQWKKIHQKI